MQKKIQQKVLQNNNIDMHHANKNAKNMRQVVVTLFPKKHTSHISLDEKMFSENRPPWGTFGFDI